MLSFLTSQTDTSKLKIYQRLLTFLALAQLPFLFFIQAAESGADGRWYALHFTIALTSILFIIEKLTSTHHKQVITKQPLMVYLITALSLLATASLSWSINVLDAIWAWKHQISYALLFFFCSYLYTEKFLKASLAILTIGLAFNAFIGIGQYHNLFTEAFNTNVIQQAAIPGATFTNKNLASQFTMMLLPIAFYFCLFAKKTHFKALSLISLTAGLIFFAYTRTRISWVSFALCLIFFALWFMFQKDLRASFKNSLHKKSIIALCGSFIIVITGASLPSAHQNTYGIKNSVTEQIKSISELTGSLINRLHYYQNSLNIVKEEPLTGVGIGNFKAAYPKYSNKSVETRVHGYSLSKRPERLHNDFLQAFVELGVLGGLLYLSIFLSLIYMLYRTQISKNISQDKKRISAILGFSCVAIIGNSIADFPLQMPGGATLLYAFIGFITAIYSQSLNLGHKNCSQKCHYSFYGILLILATAVFGMMLYDDYKRAASSFSHKALTAFSIQNNKPKEALYFAQLAYKEYPYRSHTLELRALAMRNNFNKVPPLAAISAHEEALKYDPYSGNLLVNYMLTLNRTGELLLAQNQKDAAFEVLEKSIQLFVRAKNVVPNEPKPYTYIAQAFLLKGEHANAYTYYQQALEKDPNFAPATRGIQITRILAKTHMQKNNITISLDDYLAGKPVDGLSFGQRVLQGLKQQQLKQQDE